MKRPSASLGAALAAALAAAGLAAAQLPRADTVVRPRVYVSLDPVPRERTFEVAVVAEIMKGFHINADQVLEDYLIPTTLEPALPRGFRLVEVRFPPAKRQKFEFSEQEMAVFEGRVPIRLTLAAEKDAPLGEVRIPMTLRYQACNDVACLPPVRKPVEVVFKVAPAGARATPLHPDLFKKNQ